jgi:hypothetical protein
MRDWLFELHMVWIRTPGWLRIQLAFVALAAVLWIFYPQLR